MWGFVEVTTPDRKGGYLLPNTPEARLMAKGLAACALRRWIDDKLAKLAKTKGGRRDA